MPTGPALTADSEVLTFHKNTYVFDGLSIAYVLGACPDNRGFCWGGERESDSVRLMSKSFRPWKIDEPQILPPIM
jgi:hypothetical protein